MSYNLRISGHAIFFILILLFSRNLNAKTAYYCGKTGYEPPLIQSNDQSYENIQFYQDNQISSDMFRDIPLEELDLRISEIEPDSIESYIETLQSFPPRFIGTAANAQAREYLVSKFEEFGYTPVLDTFNYFGQGAHNIMAYNEGISFPEYYIIIGAHYDAVPGSPGATDDGSGTAGVLEIARLIKNYETQVTFVFALFDAEEVGVIGSSYMADRFYESGDSVIIMLNMDEIGYDAGYSNEIRIFYGSDITYPLLFRQLAYDLPSVDMGTYLSGSTYYSDHYPFQSAGFNVIFAYGYNTSPYRHTPRDSAVYINPGYIARIARSVMAMALVVDDQHTPSPGLVFDYPGDIPETVSGQYETTFEVTVNGIAGDIPAPESGQIHYSVDGGSFMTEPMIEFEDNHYRVTLPAFNCNNSEIQFYVSVQEMGGETFFDTDPSQPNTATIATEPIIAYMDDFEIDRGWSIFDGLWAIGSPVGLGGNMGSPDPVGGYNSPNCLAYNLYGDYESEISWMYVKSPVIDCSGLRDVKLKFWRWLSVGIFGFDYARIKAGNSATEFTTVWESRRQLSGGYWAQETVDISEIADNQSTVYIMFIMGPSDDNWHYSGWNIDDMEISGYECWTWICGDVDNTDDINILDIVYLINFLYKSGPEPPKIESADVNIDDDVNILDVVYLINFIYKNGPDPECN